MRTQAEELETLLDRLAELNLTLAQLPKRKQEMRWAQDLFAERERVREQIERIEGAPPVVRGCGYFVSRCGKESSNWTAAGTPPVDPK
jgi:hypothetical protein